MRDFVIFFGGVYVHAFGGPSYWIVEFDPYTMVSPMELLCVAEVLQQMFDDLDVRFDDNKYWFGPTSKSFSRGGNK